jgi:hypothetical protein
VETKNGIEYKHLVFYNRGQLNELFEEINSYQNQITFIQIEPKTYPVMYDIFRFNVFDDFVSLKSKIPDDLREKQVYFNILDLMININNNIDLFIFSKCFGDDTVKNYKIQTILKEKMRVLYNAIKKYDEMKTNNLRIGGRIRRIRRTKRTTTKKRRIRKRRKTVRSHN